MNRSSQDYILIEKKMNALVAKTEATVPHPNTVTFRESTNVPPMPQLSSTMKYQPTEIRRVPLTKAYSCSDSPSHSGLDHCSFITPQQVDDMLSRSHPGPRVPIVDCRSQLDFGSERIRSSHNVNCQAKLIARKLSSKCLEDVEPNLTVSFNHSKDVILYDQATDIRARDKMRSLPINLAVQAAKKSNKTVHIIQGGFDAIKSQCPHLVECARREIPDRSATLPTPDTIDKENVPMTEILPHVYVGNMYDAQHSERLNENGITHIINATPDLPLRTESKYKCLRVPVLDSPSQSIRDYFELVSDFIDAALRSKTNKVLVHCSAGISRSPTLVLAYMIMRYHLSVNEAFEKMRALRPIVDPNIGFIVQLRNWESKCQASTELADDASSSSGATHGSTTRATSSSAYCGSTSKSKADGKSHADSPIIVK